MRFLFYFVLFLSICMASAQEQARLLRFPAIYGNSVVFTYAGDLYRVSARGGTARRLTSHPGFEMFARFSGDGKSLAFTGQYDGNTEVYVMPSQGGSPRRLTYSATLWRDDVTDRMGPNNIVMGWSADSKKIIFRSRMISFNSFVGQLYLVSLSGDIPEQLPLPEGGFCSYSPDGKKLAYNRIFREFRTWKRYRGGMADDVWIYDFASKKTINITNNPAQDIIPMWHGKQIYFLSDRGPQKKMNLYVYDNGNARRLTDFKEFDIKFPSIGPKAIVFENGGYLYRFSLAKEQYLQIPIYIHDDACNARSQIISVKKQIRNFDLAPGGKRALFSARGEIFTVPAEYGPTRNLTQTSGAREREATWSPDGKWLCYISDASGEEEIMLQKYEGKAQAIVSNDKTFHYQLVWSPDSKKIMWADRLQRLRMIDIETKKISEIDYSHYQEFNDYSWSPDSNWICYSKHRGRAHSKIYLYSVANAKRYAVTGQWYSSSQPLFSPDGKYLYFVSNRNLNPKFSWTEWNHSYQDMAELYLIVLAKNTPSPFSYRSDELVTKAKKEKNKDKKSKVKVKVQIDMSNIQNRIVHIPVVAGSYWHLSAVAGKLFYFHSSTKSPRSQLCFFDFNKRKQVVLGQADHYTFAPDNKNMIVYSHKNNGYAIFATSVQKLSWKKKLKLDNMEMELNRRREWQQIYRECWRRLRDFFYLPNMHGLNWERIYDKYRPLVDHVVHRADLGYIIGELIGELNTSHCYINGGDYPVAKRMAVGLLGAHLVRDKQSGYYRIKKILQGWNWDSRWRSPLTEIGVNAKKGDYIVEVDGISTTEIANIYHKLCHKVGKQVSLKISSTPDKTKARKVVVVPIADESALYYNEWVQNNIDKVNKATNGRVGYIHIPDMLTEGLNQFIKYFYSQLDKEALIIDVRGNGGGNVSPMIIERLRRKMAMIGTMRNCRPEPDPSDLNYGPKVCLINEYSASDGDLFPYRFRKHKLGKLIGRRTWGGVIGYRGSLPLIDGAHLHIPEFGVFDLQGKKWIIEGHGVDPDIVVDNDPAEEYAGNDQQLNKAIQVIMKELKTKAHKIPSRPAPPKEE